MPSRRAVIVSSCEPCASATSKSAPLAQRRSAPRRCVICRAFWRRERPPCLPITSACRPCSSSSCSVCAYSRAVISTSSPRSAHDLDQRPEHEHVRARRHVDPDFHTSNASMRADRSVGGSCSTWRSYQSVNASRPHSWRLQSCAPATCSSSRRATGSGWKKPCERSVVRRQRLARERLELAAQPGRSGNREAALAAVHDLARQQRRRGLAKQHLLREPAHLVLRGQREREVRHDGVEERTRASSECAIDARSVFTSRSSTR